MISAGQTSAVFNVTLLDGGLTAVWHAARAQATASAQNLAGASASITLFDDQTPPAPFYPRPKDLSSNNPVSIQLTWSPGIGEGVEHLANGDFESGNFSGWVLATTTNAGFTINNGSFIPPSQDGPTDPFAGIYSAVAWQSPTGVCQMQQDVALPANAGSVLLSWADCVRNFAANFDTNQQFRVELRNTNNAPLAVVFATQPGDAPLGNWAQRAADSSAYRGQTIRVVFLVTANVNYLDVHLDAISVRVSSLPAINFQVYFGTNNPPRADATAGQHNQCLLAG